MNKGHKPAARRGSATAMLAVLALVATACGARLTPEVRDAAIAGMARSGAVVVTADGDGGAGGSNGVGSSSGGAVTTDGSGAVTGETGAVSSGEVPTGGSTSAPGSAAAPGTTGTGAVTANGRDTRSMPAGGNGGETDVGVFADRIVLGNAVDNSGAVPGIFIDAQLAMQAYVAFFNSTEGTIYGRRLAPALRDTRLDAGGNREAYLYFCENAFAAAGSMSAFDEGVVGPVKDCGIPDIRAAVVNPLTMALPTVYSADAISASLYPTNHYLYWDEAYPGAKDRAAILYVDNDTTQQQTRFMRKAAESVGYTYVVDEAIGLAETNYSTYVIKLKEQNARFVEFQGDAPQAVNLAKAMRQQNYWPDVFALQQNLYKPALIQQGGSAIETTEIALGSVMNENIAHHPELQTYRTWLKQIDPSAEPTGQGMYAWAAAKLFVQLAKEIGPHLTREKMVAALGNVHNYDANGSIPPQDIGRRIPANCHIMAKVSGGKFVALEPGGGRNFVCRGQNANTT